MQKFLTLISLMIAVITFTVTVTTVTTVVMASMGDAYGQAPLDIMLGVAAIVIGLLVWFPINLALWLVSGRPQWLLIVLLVQAVPTILAVLLATAGMTILQSFLQGPIRM